MLLYILYIYVCVIYVTSVLASLQAWIYTEKKKQEGFRPRDKGLASFLCWSLPFFLSFFFIVFCFFLFFPFFFSFFILLLFFSVLCFFFLSFLSFPFLFVSFPFLFFSQYHFLFPIVFFDLDACVSCVSSFKGCLAYWLDLVGFAWSVFLSRAWVSGMPDLPTFD